MLVTTSMTTVNAMLEPSLFPESLYWGLRDSQGHFRCFICATCCIFISCLSISYPSCWFFLWKCIVTWLLFYPVCLIFTLHGSSQMSPSQRPALNPPESTSPIFFFYFSHHPGFFLLKTPQSVLILFACCLFIYLLDYSFSTKFEYMLSEGRNLFV